MEFWGKCVSAREILLLTHIIDSPFNTMGDRDFKGDCGRTVKQSTVVYHGINVAAYTFLRELKTLIYQSSFNELHLRAYPNTLRVREVSLLLHYISTL